MLLSHQKLALECYWKEDVFFLIWHFTSETHSLRWTMKQMEINNVILCNIAQWKNILFWKSAKLLTVAKRWSNYALCQRREKTQTQTQMQNSVHEKNSIKCYRPSLLISIGTFSACLQRINQDNVSNAWQLFLIESEKKVQTLRQVILDWNWKNWRDKSVCSWILAFFFPSLDK